MCFYQVVSCTSCNATVEVQQQCHYLYPFVPSSEAQHQVEVNAAPMEGLCSSCEALESMCMEMNLSMDKPIYPEPPVEVSMRSYFLRTPKTMRRNRRKGRISLWTLQGAIQGGELDGGAGEIQLH